MWNLFRKDSLDLVNEEIDAKATKFRIFETQTMFSSGFTLYESGLNGPSSTLAAANIMIGLGSELEEEYKVNFETSWTATGTSGKSKLEEKNWTLDEFEERVDKIRIKQDAIAKESGTKYVKQLADGTPELQHLKMMLTAKNMPFDGRKELKEMMPTLNEVALKHTIETFDADRDSERKRTKL